MARGNRQLVYADSLRDFLLAKTVDSNTNDHSLFFYQNLQHLLNIAVKLVLADYDEQIAAIEELEEFLS